MGDTQTHRYIYIYVKPTNRIILVIIKMGEEWDIYIYNIILTEYSIIMITNNIIIILFYHYPIIITLYNQLNGIILLVCHMDVPFRHLPVGSCVLVASQALSLEDLSRGESSRKKQTLPEN